MGRPQKRPDLTPEALDDLLYQGTTQAQIARRYSLSQATVSRRVKNLMQSLNNSSDQKPSDSGSLTTTGVGNLESSDPLNDAN